MPRDFPKSLLFHQHFITTWLGRGFNFLLARHYTHTDTHPHLHTHTHAWLIPFNLCLRLTYAHSSVITKGCWSVCFVEQDWRLLSWAATLAANVHAFLGRWRMVAHARQGTRHTEIRVSRPVCRSPFSMRHFVLGQKRGGYGEIPWLKKD